MELFETGGNLYTELAEIARKWFITNKVEVPKTATEWRSRSVTEGEIPPGMGYSTLVSRKKVRIKTLISIINNDTNITFTNINPITKDNIVELVGLEWLDYKIVNGHKKVLIRCYSCKSIEWLDYGTLQRQRKSNNKSCRYCRNAGGKPKRLEEYTIKGFEVVSLDNNILTYKCNKCNNLIHRGRGYAKESEYLVCEFCYPNTISGTKITTEYGSFDSYIEYTSFKILLQYFSIEDIQRQKKYSDLFGVNTKHTADFYIPSLDIVLEITTKSNNLRTKYYKTAEWKKSLSDKVIFAYSVKEVEDIVRSLLKDRE